MAPQTDLLEQFEKSTDERLAPDGSTPRKEKLSWGSVAGNAAARDDSPRHSPPETEKT